MDDEGEKNTPVLLGTQVNNSLHSIFSIVEVYINNQERYKSNGLYAHKSYFSNNLKGAISEYKQVLLCRGFDCEEFPDDIIETPLCDPFFEKENEIASSFMLFDKWLHVVL